MQKIYFKKMVDLNHQLKELVSISVDESIQYKMETKGMRAVGSIMINGEYKDEKIKNAFHETIDLDMMALFEKITDKRDFHVKVEDFDYSITDGNLSLVIQTYVYGVLDDEDRMIDTSSSYKETQSQTIIENEDREVTKEIENLLREEEEKVDEQFDIPVIETTQQENTIEMQEDDDDDDLGTYYLYVVREGDTYQSIAHHYQVDEYQLKNYNHDRVLTSGTIVIVPYSS